MDAFRRNLFARQGAGGAHEEQPGGQTVAIDWAFTGIGAVGEEIVPLVAASLIFLEVERARGQELERMAMQGYLQGLRDAGWDGDPRLVHLGFATTAALRYSLGGMGEFIPAMLDESTHPMMEQVWGLSIGELVDRSAPAMERVGDGADRARELLDALP
jgi:hypothetical protein